MTPRRIFLLSLSLGLVGLAWTLRPSAGAADTQDKEALAAAEAWLKLVDAQDYGKSWDEAASFFRGAVKKGQWIEAVKGVRGPIGALKSRKVSSATPATELPGAPDGHYLIIQYSSSFANKANATETVTPMKDQDGRWRVSGYYVK
ncbi:MAG: DUF4019 domain-containing protein [Myxococcota bacterium]